MPNAEKRLFKFRPLGSPDDFCRAQDILRTGRFWCAPFSELNDPMEGIFQTLAVGKWEEILDGVSNLKSQYKICSFCGKEGAKRVQMWGYYANGFKGIAIEIRQRDVKVEEIGEEGIVKIKYDNATFTLDQNQNVTDLDVLKILTTKSKAWKSEKEYRYLKKDPNDKHIVGEIVAVHFGNPFGHAFNRNEIRRDSNNLRSYLNFAEELKRIAERLHVPTPDTQIIMDGVNDPWVRLEP